MTTDIRSDKPKETTRDLRAMQRSAIIALLTRGPVMPGYGVCVNLPEYVPRGMRLSLRAGLGTLTHATAKRLWGPGLGGPYPIPGGEEAYLHHQAHGTLWKGKQLAYRQLLLREMLRTILDDERTYP